MNFLTFSGTNLPIRQVCSVVQGEECILIGTLFKQMNLQPSILKELSDEIDVPIPSVAAENFTSDDDTLYLEDMLQRIVLVGDINKNDLVTGKSYAVEVAHTKYFF